MLLKLLKYEIKSSYGRFVVAFLLYILIASVLLIFFRNHETLNTSVLVFGIIALCVITFLTIFNRYNTNLYHSEGYLMLTLPVDGKMLMTSKLISAFIWMFALALIIVPSILILIYCYSEQSLINETYKFIEMNKAYTIVFGIEYLLGLINTVFVIYFSISISKLQIWRKFGVLGGISTYFVIELLSSIPVLLFNNSIGNTKSTTNFSDMVQQYPINSIVFQCFFMLFTCVLLFLATSYLLNNRTSLK